MIVWLWHFLLKNNASFLFKKYSSRDATAKTARAVFHTIDSKNLEGSSRNLITLKQKPSRISKTEAMTNYSTCSSGAKAFIAGKFWNWEHQIQTVCSFYNNNKQNWNRHSSPANGTLKIIIFIATHSISP